MIQLDDLLFITRCLAGHLASDPRHMSIVQLQSSNHRLDRRGCGGEVVNGART